MSKIVKNISEISKTYAGMMIGASEPYLIPDSELLSFQNSSKLIEDLSKATPEASIYDSESSIELTGAEGVSFLLTNSLMIKEVPQSYPFNNKYLPDGKKIYRRKHGLKGACMASEECNVDFIIPYAHCKIDEIELIDSNHGDCTDTMVLDSADGSYSGVPSLILNQFGFNVNISEGYHSDSSSYEADLYIGMVVRVTYKNIGIEDATFGVNLVLHEVK